jgi:hypothetical protein
MVTLTGAGTVVSSPTGIECGRTCTAAFPMGTTVVFSATPAAGGLFGGWTGACSGQGTCSLTLTGDASLGAPFSEPPPPPPQPDECAGMVPASLPGPAVASLPDSDCQGGTSDDGAGNYLLGFMAGADIRFPEYLFFTVEGGQARAVGDRIVGGDESSTRVFSQPSGFASFQISGMTGGSAVSNFTHDGARSSTQTVVESKFGPVADTPGSRIGIDPSGGTAAVRTVKDERGAWLTSYRRLGKTGVPETDWVPLDSAQARTGPGAVGVALSGDVLVVLAAGPSAWRANWYRRDGKALTAWFDFQGSGLPELQFLMDGSLALRFRGPDFPFDEGPWVGRFEDGEAGMSPAPEWLLQRGANALFVVRNGKAYASWGGARQCGANLEVVAALSGKSCGCLPVPNLGDKASVGRDGSLIVPRPEPSVNKCQYDLYPQLLR